MYKDIEVVFDESSEKYDYNVLKNLSRRLMYYFIIEYLLMNFKKEEIVLDLGCGTGLEAIPLAKKGINIVAVDVSQGMLQILKRKIEKYQIKNIKIHKLAIGEISSLIKIYGEESFDGAYSIFGPLNSEPNIAKFSYSLFKLLKPKGKFVASIINRWYIYDMLKFKPRMEFGKYKDILFKYYTPFEFILSFKNFRLNEILGIGIFLPQPKSIIKNEKLINILFKLDKHISKRFPFKYLGTDFIVNFYK